MDMLIGRRCRFFLSGYSSPLVYIGKLQHQKRKRSMMANFGGGLQRDRIYIPMAAESVPCLQRRKKYGSMMAARIIVLQRSKTYRRMMATDTLIRYIAQAHVSSWLCLHYKNAACFCSP